MFLNCLTCFGRHTAHHQELQKCNCNIWFYIRFWLPGATMAEPSQRPATKIVCKTRGCDYSFGAFDNGRCSSETCWAIKKYWNNKLYCTVTSCSFYDISITMHGSMNTKFINDEAFQCVNYLNLPLSQNFLIFSTYIYTLTTRLRQILQ
jgi:hypothetical protein